MKVWVAESGCYEQRYISGVYATAEAAMADHPLPRTIPADFKPTAADYSRPGGWVQSDDGSWDNGLDWDDSVTIYPMDVEGAA